MLFLTAKKAVGTGCERKFLACPSMLEGRTRGCLPASLGLLRAECVLYFIVLLCLCSFSASYVVVSQICWLSGVILMLKLVRKGQIHWEQFWAHQMSRGKEPECLLAHKTK